MKKSFVIALHVGYWLMYLFLITIFFYALKISNPAITFNRVGFQFLFSPIAFGAIIPAIIGFYGFYNFVFSSLKSSTEIVKALLKGIGISFIASIIAQVCMYLFLKKDAVNWSTETCITMGIFLAFIAFVHGCIAFIIKGFLSWMDDLKNKSELNKKNYDIEMALLKSQINPHFLFNTINNIDTLIAKDATQASNYLNKLSDIMRYMLYEAKSDLVPLQKEIDYIEKFIELQKIRTNNSQFINYEIQGNSTHKTIPPMLFISFIENAFKHVQQKKEGIGISISIDIKQNEIVFTSENVFNHLAPLQQDGNGLGINLIKRRLALLYPNKHTLTIRENNDIYAVKLILN
jgi:hypothetical protein